MYLIYIESNDVKTIDEVYSHFGSPQTVAKDFNGDIDSVKIKKSINRKKTVIIAAVIIVLMLAVYLIAAFIDGSKSSGGYMVTTIDNVTTETTTAEIN